MRMMLKAAIVCAAFAAAGATGAQGASPCDNGPAAKGMSERMETIKRQTDKIEWTADRLEQRRLMELQMKHMRESLRELRRRDLPAECRMESMNTMLDAMVRHEQVMHDNPAH